LENVTAKRGGEEAGAHGASSGWNWKGKGKETTRERRGTREIYGRG